jgi:hypothetical protein
MNEFAVTDMEVLKGLDRETLVGIVKTYWPKYRPEGVDKETLLDDIARGQIDKPHLAKFFTPNRTINCPVCSDTGLVPPYDNGDFCNCKAGQKRIALLRDCAGLSGGTIASITGEKMYDNIDVIQAAFVGWVHMHIVLYPNWQSAWEDFKNSAAYRVAKERI